MRPLSNRYRKAVSGKSKLVTDWLAESNAVLESQIAAPNEGEERGRAFAGIVSAFASVGLLLSLLYTGDPRSGYKWPAIGWVFAGLLVVGVAAIVLVARRGREYGEYVRMRLNELRKSDPLYQRARLIAEAMSAFCAHCDRYAAWYEAVDEGLQPSDEEAADRFLAFLARAAEVIERAIDNFGCATELTRKRAEFVKTHPTAGAAPQSTALSELIARLDEPTEVPNVPALPDAREALEFEEALEELSEELRTRSLPVR